MSDALDDALQLSAEHQKTIDAYLPPASTTWTRQDRPFVTLTFATSLDSQLSLAPGVRTALSGPVSKAMTHYLRSKYDAILIGVGTAIADDPGLNCRISGSGGYGGPGVTQQPRPVIVDPACRWRVTESSKIMQLVQQGRGLGPWVLTSVSQPPDQQRKVLEEHGGGYIVIEQDALSEGKPQAMDWSIILSTLAHRNIRSIMIEGGGQVINQLLAEQNQLLIDSVIVTIAPTWLGDGGVVVSPPRKGASSLPVARLCNVRWHPMGDDVVLCGRLHEGKHVT